MNTQVGCHIHLFAHFISKTAGQILIKFGIGVLY